jgi:hypothetical protein
MIVLLAFGVVFSFVGILYVLRFKPVTPINKRYEKQFTTSSRKMTISQNQQSKTRPPPSNRVLLP